MSIPIEGLRTVIYPAANLEQAKAWWTELLGYGPYFDEPFYVGFNVGGYELGLLPDANTSDGPLVYWGVSDVEMAVNDAIESGALEHTASTDVGDGIITATVTTPFGTILGFIFNPHFSLD